MKYKVSLITLLMVGLFAFAFSANAAINFTVTAATNTIATQKAGAMNVVLTAFTATESNVGSDAISAFKVENPGNGFGTELAKLSIYNDVNGNGLFDNTDTLVAGATSTATTNYIAGTGLTLNPTTAINFARAASKKYLVVADLSKADGGIVDKHTFGAAVSGTATSGAIAADTQAAGILNLVASHLRFVSAGYNKQVATNGEILVTAQNLLAAVDDYGNVDVDFVEVVKLSAVNYFTLDDISGGLTATATAAGAVDMKATGLAMNAGLLHNTLAGAAGELFSVKSTTAGPVTLVATSVTSKLEGSTTICNEALAAGAPVINQARGIEVYDTDHNGYIDHMTIFFDKPVEPNGAAAADFIVAGYTVAAGNALANFDGGGVGIRNAGTYGISVTLTEKDVYDTNATPVLTYLASTKIRGLAGGTAVAAFGSAQAVVVDKARPVLISAITKDSGIGAGTASNGVLDGIQFTFSEPVQNVTAGPTIVPGATGYTALALPVVSGMSFNQGNGTAVANVLTIPIGETTINTGVTPSITYSEANAASLIADYATSATHAPAANKFYAGLNAYGVGNTTIATADGAPMVVHSVETLDTNNNGKLDAIRVTFSEKAVAGGFTGVDFYTSIAAFASDVNANGIYTPTAVGGSGTPQLTFAVTPNAVANVYDTEATPSFRFDPTTAGASITDGVGNSLGAYGPGGLSHAATIDMAPPVVVGIVTGDAYADSAYVGESGFESAVANGRLDNVKLIFSEKVKTIEGAQYGGTALDHAVAQFTINHALAADRTKMLTTAATGKPTWTDSDTNGDTKTELVITFNELSHAVAGMVNGGDTGAAVAVTYGANATTSYNVVDYAAVPNNVVTALPASTDGAAPFIVADASVDKSPANVLTYDKPEDLPGTPARAAGNVGKGNGYLEGFTLKFTEAVTFSGAGAALQKFSATPIGGGELSFNDAGAALLNNGSNAVTVIGVRTKAGAYDTGTTPTLTYAKDDAVLTIKDAAQNKLAAFEALPSFDNAAPAIVGVNGDGNANTNKLNFTFSEPVYAHDADGKSISFNAASVSSSSLFGFDNLGAGPGSSGFTAANVVQPSANVLQATLNANLTVVDINNDLVWVKAASIFDDANSLYPTQNDNITANAVAGATIKLWIMDDVIAPWITGIKTIDWNGNGKVDHLRVQFSEAMQDATVKGFVSDNAMSDDVSATWKLSGYSGPARWNFFAPNADGYAAAIAAGKPVFSDNGKNNDVMYLELDEDAVPVNAVTGIGSTGFKPTVTWGTGAAAETLGDFRPNLLDTASTVTAAPAATNGTVTDFVAPVIVGATVSGTKLTVLFSEPVADTGTAANTDDFVFGTTAAMADAASIYGAVWKDTSTLELTLKSNYGFTAGTAYGIQLETGATNQFKDAAGNMSIKYGDDISAVFNGATYVAQSPIAAAAYVANPNTLGAFKISNLAVLANNSTAPASGATIAAGSTVTLKWTASNIENVAVYQSFNSGVTYEMVPGSTIAASAGSTTWTAKLGVTNVKVQAVGGSAAISFGYTVVYNGSVVGSSIGAPSALAVYDVPNDNGGFVYAKFTKSADHLTTVNSYQFYREVTVVDSTKSWVLWATVAAGVPDADGKLTVIVPTIWNDSSKWMVAASTGKLISEGTTTAKVAADATPVADVVYAAGAAKTAAVENVSSFTEAVEGAAIDNIAPSALTTVTAADNAGAGTGVLVSWVAPADHGIVDQYKFNGVTNFVYGVDSYEVYRKANGTQNYVLAGTAGSGSTSFTDAIADGATMYSYLVKALDSAHSVETVVPGKVMAGNGTSDFNADGVVGLSDLVLLGNMWDLKNTSADFVANFDLNHDGAIGLGDLVLLGGAWTPASAKVAKAAGEVPMSNIAFQMVSSVSEGNKMYYVSINTKDAANINAVSFSLKYDASKFEFVSDSVTGLGDIPLVKADQAGIIDIASLYTNEKFNGTVTIGFKAKDAKSDMNVEMVNAEVSLNGMINSVKNAETVMLKALPQTYALSQNFPNPFNPTTTIEYSIPTTGNVSLVIYNVAGQKVRTLVNNNQSANFYKVVWDGKNDNGMTVGTGTYFYKLVSGNYSKIVKMTLMK